MFAKISIKTRFMVVVAIGISIAAIAASLAFNSFETKQMHQVVHDGGMDELQSLKALIVSAMARRLQDPESIGVGVFNDWFGRRNQEYSGELWSTWSPPLVDHMRSTEPQATPKLPRDDLDQAALSTGQIQSRFENGSFRLSLPIRLGVTTGTEHESCPVCHEPMGLKTGDVIAVLSTRVSTAREEAEVRDAMLTMAGVALAVLILFVLGIRFGLEWTITGPLAAMTRSMTALAGGDLSVQFPKPQGHNEISEMVQALGVFRDGLAERAHLSAEHAAIEERQRRAGQRAMLEMCQMVEKDIDSTVRKITAQSEITAQSASAVSEAVGEIRTQATVVASTAEQAHVNASAVASVTDQVAAAGHEIAQQAVHASNVAREGVGRAQHVAKAIDGLRSATSRISEVAKLIASIASQTNLLALNATIEAARAGAAGRGFTVVANEVKTLAGQTASATQEISAQIANVQHAAENSIAAIEGVIQVISDIDGRATAVSAAVEEQYAANGEICRNVSEVAQGAQQVSQSVAAISGYTQTASALALSVEAKAQETNAAVIELKNRLTIALRQSSAGNRRENDRIPVRIPSVLEVGGCRHSGTTVDLSINGGLIRVDQTAATFTREQRLKVEINGVGVFNALVVGVNSRGVNVVFEPQHEQQCRILEDRVGDLLEADRAYIGLAQEMARTLGAALESALDRHEISQDDLFSDNYNALPDTSPAQFMAPFTALTDRLFPAVQESALNALPGVIFCCATDRNGYIPTHNAKYSQPQRPGDVVWNTGNSRNRRFFDDPAGISAARSNRPFFMQAYDRDMGGGQRILVKEIDAPIMVHGHQWGALRLGFSL